MGRSSDSRSRRRFSNKLRPLFTYEGSSPALARETKNGCYVITDSSTTFIQGSFLVELVDECDQSLGWLLDMEHRRCQ